MSKVAKLPKSTENELEKIKKNIKTAFNINLKLTEALKILAWKSQNSQTYISEKKLLELLHGT